ncbi:NAD(P)-dependent alcohol dehydrogenase [Bacillus sp. 3255]|uniref:NAD(P)-dependent alcohol dehydrogenase n=1 Tax=Bacillus sp. 3255 TaxID=2817904 RepID=UPI00285A9DF0|nr:NAD(P)-dependent alcohol dehydrogenase [Bacillus sp. 3255]MDR6879903.1 NADPH:quinone reductase-like Zn-dependent oxidoreductase [Bacillus sp. 3255]
MKAIVYSKYGTTAELKLQDVERPTPKNDEVLIRVHASSINSWDWDLLRGKPFLVRLGGLRKPRYPILGADVAGRVVAVGKDVTQLKPGDDVFGDISGCGWGGFAEYVCARENSLTLKPAHMSFEEIAAVPQAAVLALQGLRKKGLLQSGMKVLINGAGGGVGTFAVQIAKSFGAEVTGVDKARKLDILRSLGADHVIDYMTEDFTRNGLCYDLILDVAGYRSIWDYKRALSPSGTYVMIGGSMSRIVQVMLLGPLISMCGSKKMGILAHKPDRRDQEYMKKLFESGQVVPVIDRHYPLGEVREALQFFGEGLPLGKIVIRVDS